LRKAEVVLRACNAISLESNSKYVVNFHRLGACLEMLLRIKFIFFLKVSKVAVLRLHVRAVLKFE